MLRGDEGMITISVPSTLYLTHWGLWFLVLSGTFHEFPLHAKTKKRFVISIAKVACRSNKPQWVNKGRLLSSLNNSADWRSVNFAGKPDYLTLKVLQKGHQPSCLIYYHSKEVGCKSITTISPLGRGRLYHNRCIRHFLSPLGWPASWAFFL